MNLETILNIAFILCIAAFAFLWDEVWKDKKNS